MDVVEDGHDRGRLRRRLEQLAHRPWDLLARGRRLLLAEQWLDRRDRLGLEPELRGRRELLQHLDHRPVRDALAVGEAAASHHGRIVEPGAELSGEPRLADSSDAEDGEELAGAVVDGLFECLLQPAELAGAADERRIEPSCEGESLFVQRDQALREKGLALALQLERDGLALDGITEELCGLGPE